MSTVVTHQFSSPGEADESITSMTTSCHPFMALPLELRLLIWENFGSEPRVFEYREDTGLIRPPHEFRHPRRVGLGVCAESRAAIKALLKPFEHPHDIERPATSATKVACPPSPTSPSPAPLLPSLGYVPTDDIFYLPPMVFGSRIQAWDTIWTTKPGIRNVGVHWSVLYDERRIREALDAAAVCFTDMTALVVFVEFRPFPEPEDADAAKGGSIRLLGAPEDDYRLPSLYAEKHGLMDEFWTWGEMKAAIAKVRKARKGAPEVEGVLYCREVEISEP